MDLDEKLLPDSSSEHVTAADVDDFGDYNERFIKSRLGQTEESKPDPVSDKPNQAESATAKTGEPQESEDKPKSQPQKILTEADVERMVEARLKASQPKAEEKADPMPRLGEERFPSHEAWEAELEKWQQRQNEKQVAAKFAEREQQSVASQQAERQFQERLTKFEQRVSAATERFKAQGIDYQAVKAIADTMPFHEESLQYVLDSEVGPEMIEYFTRNQSEWSQVIAMQPEDRKIEMRIIERELKRGQSVAPARQVAKTVSSAKEPPKFLGGKQAPAGDPKDRDNSTPDDETGFAAHMRTFTQERLRNRSGQYVGAR